MCTYNWPQFGAAVLCKVRANENQLDAGENWNQPERFVIGFEELTKSRAQWHPHTVDGVDFLVAIENLLVIRLWCAIPCAINMIDFENEVELVRVFVFVSIFSDLFADSLSKAAQVENSAR